MMDGGRAVDTYNFGTGDDTNIVLWSYWGGDAQQYGISDVGDGYVRITPRVSSGQSIEAAWTNNGDNIRTWSYYGGDRQQWSIQ